MKKSENTSRGGAEKGKGQRLGDLVITNHHNDQLDVHQWSIVSVLSSDKRCRKVCSTDIDHVDIYLFIRLPKLTQYRNTEF